MAEERTRGAEILGREHGHGSGSPPRGIGFNVQNLRMGMRRSHENTPGLPRKAQIVRVVACPNKK